jgi:hypothetical protein
VKSIIIKEVLPNACEISCSHVNEYKDDSLLGFGAVEADRRLRRVYCPEDGGSTHLWTAGLFLGDCHIPEGFTFPNAVI